MENRPKQRSRSTCRRRWGLPSRRLLLVRLAATTLCVDRATGHPGEIPDSAQSLQLGLGVRGLCYRRLRVSRSVLLLIIWLGHAVSPQSRSRPQSSYRIPRSVSVEHFSEPQVGPEDAPQWPELGPTAKPIGAESPLHSIEHVENSRALHPTGIGNGQLLERLTTQDQK